MGDAAAGETRWNSLDGVRALAVILVIATHFGLHATQGQIGVDLFFVLSGFLITSILVKEHDRTDRVSLTNFWKRRALRLFPALGCAIAFALTLSLATSPVLRHSTITGLPFVLGYIGNWAILSSHSIGLMGHTWSLAIEEQFYLIWPLVGVAWLCQTLNRERAAKIIATVAVVDAFYFMFALGHWAPGRAIFGTDTHAFGLLAGSALALWLNRPRRPTLEAQTTLLLRTAGATAAIVIVFLACFGGQVDQVAVPATAMAVLLVASLVLAPFGALGSVFACRPMQWVGRRSYGIYLYHYPLALAFVIGHNLHGMHLVAVVSACITSSILLAAASFRWIETPFLRYKDRIRIGSPSNATAEPVRMSATSQ